MKNNNNYKKSTKSQNPRKYYYTKASIIRSVVVSLLCFSIFLVFFVCFMIYGGNDRNATYFYKGVYKNEEREVLSMIDAIAVDGKGRLFTFFSRTLQINVYDEEGKVLECYQIPCFSYETTGDYDGGIACMDGKLYAFNDVGEVFVFEDGKGVESFTKESNKDKFNQIYKLYKSGKNKAVSESGKTFHNYFFAVMDDDGNVIVDNFLRGVFFSPFSMVMSIVMTVLTYLSVRRYNKKVRNEKIKTLFKKSVKVE